MPWRGRPTGASRRQNDLGVGGWLARCQGLWRAHSGSISAGNGLRQPAAPSGTPSQLVAALWFISKAAGGLLPRVAIGWALLQLRGVGSLSPLHLSRVPQETPVRASLGGRRGDRCWCLPRLLPNAAVGGGPSAQAGRASTAAGIRVRVETKGHPAAGIRLPAVTAQPGVWGSALALTTLTLLARLQAVNSQHPGTGTARPPGAGCSCFRHVVLLLTRPPRRN